MKNLEFILQFSFWFKKDDDFRIEFVIVLSLNFKGSFVDNHFILSHVLTQLKLNFAQVISKRIFIRVSNSYKEIPLELRSLSRILFYLVSVAYNYGNSPLIDTEQITFSKVLFSF